MAKSQPRKDLYTFGVVYFDAHERVVASTLFYTYADSLDHARKGLNREGLFAIGPDTAVLCQAISARDVCCAEFRRGVTIEGKYTVKRATVQ